MISSTVILRRICPAVVNDMAAPSRSFHHPSRPPQLLRQHQLSTTSDVMNFSSSAVAKPKQPLPHAIQALRVERSLLEVAAQRHPSRLEQSSSVSTSLDAHQTADAHQTINNAGSALIDRKIRIKRRRSSATINNNQQIQQNGSVKRRDCMNGYKYRLLTTPQLTNDLITLQPEYHEHEHEHHLSDGDISTPNHHAISSSQIIQKENHDIHQLQQQYTNDTTIREGRARTRFPTEIKDLLSSQWWRNLYHQGIDSNAQTTSSNNTQLQPPSSLANTFRNRRSSTLLEETNIIGNGSYTGSLPDERQNLEEEEQGISERVRVRSVQAASSIDVVAVLSKVFGGGVSSQYTNEHPLSDFFASSPPLRHVFGRTNIIVQLSPPPINCSPSLSHNVQRYVAIYRFGSVVFFNLTTKESSRLLEQIKKHAVDPIAVGFERREHFEMALQPRLETATGKITADRAGIRELDMNTVGIVSNIMGQTVALDWHNDTVDELLAKFSSVNSSVERTGGFTSIERNTLFQVVARNNSLFIDMVSKLGIKDRSDTAWHLSQYEGLHEGMRKEFDLDERFRVSSLPMLYLFCQKINLLASTDLLCCILYIDPKYIECRVQA